MDTRELVYVNTVTASWSKHFPRVWFEREIEIFEGQFIHNVIKIFFILIYEYVKRKTQLVM